MKQFVRMLKTSSVHNQTDDNKPQFVHFALDRSTNSIESRNTTVSRSSIQQTTTFQYQQVCHRGLTFTNLDK